MSSETKKPEQLAARASHVLELRTARRTSRLAPKELYVGSLIGAILLHSHSHGGVLWKNGPGIPFRRSVRLFSGSVDWAPTQVATSSGSPNRFLSLVIGIGFWPQHFNHAMVLGRMARKKKDPPVARLGRRSQAIASETRRSTAAIRPFPSLFTGRICSA